MGGFGSGRQGGRLTVEDTLTLCIDSLLRDGRIVRGQWVAGTLRWREAQTGREVAAMAYEANLADPGAAWMRLRFGRGEGEARRDHECTLRLTTTRPRCGGLRWWFVCPLSGRRCGKLHLPPGSDAFAARQAWRLDYRSQRLPAWEREWRTAAGRASRIRRRLGGPAGRVPAHADAPPRPKGMWNSTYERRRREIEEAERCAEAASWARVEAIVGPKRRRSPEAAPGAGQGRRRKGPASSEA